MEKKKSEILFVLIAKQMDSNPNSLALCTVTKFLQQQNKN